MALEIKDMPEKMKAVMWFQGAMRQFKIWGLIGGGNIIVTTIGLALWDQIDAQWSPTDEILSEISRINTKEEKEAAALFTMLVAFRDKRGDMAKWVRESHGK